MPSYTDSSAFWGPNVKRSSAGVALTTNLEHGIDAHRHETSRTATSKCGIFAKSVITGLPASIVLQKASVGATLNDRNRVKTAPQTKTQWRGLRWAPQSPSPTGITSPRTLIIAIEALSHESRLDILHWP